MKLRWWFTLFVILTAVLMAGNKGISKGEVSDEVLAGLKFRSIGPALTSGRIVDFAVNPDNINEYYVAVASGHVWKTTNGGITYTPVFDDQGSYSIGCITIDPSNHHVVWVGTGENNSQRSVSYGDGVYKSLDGGKSWKNMGLEHSEHIAKIIIHPTQSNVVYVASQGPLWGPGGDRGVFKSEDGGKTWKNILYISENTGVTDLVMDPRNPQVLYAASYQRRRHVYTLINGGPESRIYKSQDGGISWDTLTNGLPDGDVGRIGLAISPVNPDIVYALIETENKQQGMYRSMDRGASWTHMSEYKPTSPQYYMEIVADPLNLNRVYSLNTYTMVTNDGGKTWERLNLEKRHVDDHALWINPHNNKHFLIGGDGGVYETRDGGQFWHFKANLPVTQFYRVAVDNRKPFYYVYGGTQDNFSLGGPSQTLNREGIRNSDWFVTNGGDGFESAIDPENPDIVYAQSQYGWLVRFNKKTGESVGIKPIEKPGEKPYRWNWDTPLIISPHKSSRLYFAANKVFRSEDRGNTWEIISPDLTRQLDRNKLPVMGKIWGADAVSKNKSTSVFGNIVSLTESPLVEGLIYVGTDDGLIQVTEDGGKTWQKIDQIKGVPRMTYVSSLQASRHNPNRVYACFDNHKNADFKPYVAVSNNRGKSWRLLSSGLPQNGPVYTLAEDFKTVELLFIGTEYGVFTSLNGGKSWNQLKSGLPTIAIKDMAIQQDECDLVVATFGRGFYILDDYSPLRNLSHVLKNQSAALFPVRNVLMYIPRRVGTGEEGHSLYSAPNEPFGATFTWYLKESDKTLREIRHDKEKELEKSGKPVPFPSYESLRKEALEPEPELIFRIEDTTGQIVRNLTTPMKKGVNRITWDMHYASKKPLNSVDETPGSGFVAMPGTYKVTLFRKVRGVVSQLAGPISFHASLLHKNPDESVHKARVAFQQQLTSLARISMGTSQFIRNIIKDIKNARHALLNSNGDYGNMAIEFESLEARLNSLLLKLDGDRIKQSRNEATLMSVNERLQTIMWDQWRYSGTPTNTHKESYQYAKQQFNDIYKEIKNLSEREWPQLMNKMEEVQAPWTPGRLPEYELK